MQPAFVYIKFELSNIQICIILKTVIYTARPKASGLYQLNQVLFTNQQLQKNKRGDLYIQKLHTIGYIIKIKATQNCHSGPNDINKTRLFTARNLRILYLIKIQTFEQLNFHLHTREFIISNSRAAATSKKSL